LTTAGPELKSTSVDTTMPSLAGGWHLTATSVPGVASAEWDCDFGFGGGWVRGDVVLDVTTEDEAITVIEAVLRAFAESPDLEDSWSTPQKYTTEDPSIVFSAKDVGFAAGVPNVGEVRERYGITPG